MSKYKKVWSDIKLPEKRGDITISKVLNTTPGTERDLMIKRWCISVWQAFEESHKTITSLVNTELKI
jgi:hypothetical protein